MQLSMYYPLHGQPHSGICNDSPQMCCEGKPLSVIMERTTNAWTHSTCVAPWRSAKYETSSYMFLADHAPNGGCVPWHKVTTIESRDEA
jgi:hypothetical protein